MRGVCFDLVISINTIHNLAPEECARALREIERVGKKAFITEVIEIAGGHSVTSDLEQEWPQISLEAVLERKPEALLLVRGSKMSSEQILSRPGWSTVPAIKNNRIYYVDDRIEIPSPVVFDALEELARQFHP